MNVRAVAAGASLAERGAMRIATLAFLVAGVAGAASANTGHHSSSGGGCGGEAACIRWEPIPYDMAGADMARGDMAGGDMAGAAVVDLGGESLGLDGGA